jgi:hypothetical protein
MTIATYAELIAEVEAYFDDTVTLVARHPTFIRLVESQVNRRLADPGMEIQATVTVGTGYTALPADFGGMRGVTAGDGRLKQITVSEMTGADTSITGTPRYYAIADEGIAIYPTSAGATVTIIYVADVPALTVSNTTNWLLTAYPDVYLFGCLYHAAIFTVDDARAKNFYAIFESMIEEAVMNAEALRWGAAPLQPSLGRT